MREPRILRKCARYSATVLLGVQSSPTSPDCSLADYKAAQESRQRLKLHNGVLTTPLCRPSLVPIIRLLGTTSPHLRLDSVGKWYHIMKTALCYRNHF